MQGLVAYLEHAIVKFNLRIHSDVFDLCSTSRGFLSRRYKQTETHEVQQSILKMASSLPNLAWGGFDNFCLRPECIPTNFHYFKAMIHFSLCGRKQLTLMKNFNLRPLGVSKPTDAAIFIY